MAPAEVLLFGDQTTDPIPCIKGLYQKSKSSKSLQAFFDDVSDALQKQIALLDAFERERFASFYSVIDLAESYVASGKNDVVLSTVLLCIAQVGSMIERELNAPKQSPFPQRHVLGFCTGMLAAALAAADLSLGQLLSVAPELVGVALRLGLSILRRSKQIESSADSWAAAVTGLSAGKLQSILDKFHKSNNTPSHKHAYISASSSQSLTISGPPSVLSSVFSSSDYLGNSRKIELPIYGAFHATHLPTLEVDRIIGASDLFNLPVSDHTYFFSTASGNPFESRNVHGLLHRIIEDVTQNPIDWNQTVQGVVDKVIGSEVVFSSIVSSSVTKAVHKSLKALGIRVAETISDTRGSCSKDDSGIAIVGMSGRFPSSENLDDFWEILEHGRDLHEVIPKARFDADSHCDPSGTIKNSTLSAFGCFIENPGMFDARFFNMSPREAMQADPAHRLLLMATYEALEMAGYTQQRPAGERIGTFMGQTIDDYRETNSSQDIDMYYVSGGIRAFGPGRLNYHFKWGGPSYSIDTACSSSAASIDLACSSLLARDCDMAVAGGSNLITSSNMYAGLSRGGFLSPTGQCKTFDESADGYCRADGVGVVVLKRLKDALANGDNIQGVIRSVSTNHSAYANSITQSDVISQQKLFRQVIKEASLQPEDIGYIEMHGTGTQVGDTIEMEAVAGTFGHRRRTSVDPLFVGAVKANVGHSEAAAGVTSLMKALLMFRHQAIPPHTGLKTGINHKFPPLADMNIRIPSSLEEFRAPNVDGRRRILVNNFNATGGNTCMLVQEPPFRPVNGNDPRSYHIITLSAKSHSSLINNKKRLLKYIESHPNTRIQDLAYTTTARRMHHGYRLAYIAKDVDEVITKLTTDLDAAGDQFGVSQRRSIAFVFTGQGSKYASIGKRLFESCNSFREYITNLDTICIGLGFPSVIGLIIEAPQDADCAATDVVKSQLALICLELAMANLWQSWGIEPDLVIGHSLGEYAAVCVAGVLSVADTLFLVGKRAQMIEARCTRGTHGMLAVRTSAEDVRAILKATSDTSCEISCLNSPTSTVVSGTIEDIKKLQTDCVDMDTTMLELPYAFHSSQLDPILDGLHSLVNTVRFENSTIPVVSTLLADIVSRGDVFSGPYFARQARGQVNFMGALQSCAAKGKIDEQTLFLELGLGTTCLSAIQSSLKFPTANLLGTLKSQENCWQTISRTLAQTYVSGANINWSDYHRNYKQSLNLLDLPTYSFDLKNYWIQYEGTWALTKNNASSLVAPLPKFSSVCLHKVDEEHFSADSAEVTFISDLLEPKLFALIQGHFVNGVALCPSAAYAEMALSAAKYVYSKLNPKNTPLSGIDIKECDFVRPLIVFPSAPTQLVRVNAVKNASSNCVAVTFCSRTGNEDWQQNASCTISFEDESHWLRTWSRNSYLIQDRMGRLVQDAVDGSTHRILSPMIYRLFSNIVEYSKGYQGLKEVFLDIASPEASAKVRFQSSPPETEFACNPYWLDGAMQLAGFVLNGNPMMSTDAVYLSSGWESLRIGKQLDGGKECDCYVRMQPVEGVKGAFVGDLSILQDEKIVIVVAGIKFQEIRRSMLHLVLPGSWTHSNQPVTTAAQSVSVESIPDSQNLGSLSGQLTPASSQISIDLETMLSKVSCIIADELGLSIRELDEETDFEELGIDSLLTISITSRLRRELDFELPTSIFSTVKSVSELLRYLRDTMTAFPKSSASNSVTISSSGVHTPAPAPSRVSVDRFENTLMQAITQEMGINPEELTLNTSLKELGLDSLMSISILSIVKLQTGLDIPASLLTSGNPTISSLASALKTLNAPTIPSQPTPQPQQFTSNAVLLQGSPSSPYPPLFLLTDGAGSAASYLHLPILPTHLKALPIYALESPFLHTPTSFTLPLQDLCTIFVHTILQLRPQGPYLLGGWSIGGIYAYECAYQLLTIHHASILGLLLIDSPCPRKLHDIPELTLDVLEETGVFAAVPNQGDESDGRAWDMKMHLLGCVRAVVGYEPVPLPLREGKRLGMGNVVVVWATKGLFEELMGKVKEASELVGKRVGGGEGGFDGVGLSKDWLNAKRTEFDPKGWDGLVGEVRECWSVEGDHFGIMKVPAIEKTGLLVQRALEIFLGNL